jgi:hypothetical protein
MALVALTTTDGNAVRVSAADVLALEELTPDTCRLHLGSGRTFIINQSVATTATALGL